MAKQGGNGGKGKNEGKITNYQNALFMRNDDGVHFKRSTRRFNSSTRGNADIADDNKYNGNDDCDDDNDNGNHDDYDDGQQSCKNVPTVPTSRCYFFWPVLIFGKSTRKTGENT